MKRNCYNAEKVLNFVTPSGEQHEGNTKMNTLILCF